MFMEKQCNNSEKILYMKIPKKNIGFLFLFFVFVLFVFRVQDL